MIDLSRCREEPFAHQIVGVDALVRWDDTHTGRIIGGCFFITDEMGAGKTKQVIDAAQVLYEQGDIKRVIVVAPAPVRDVWFDPQLGELAKHLWNGTPSKVMIFHQKWRQWLHDADNGKALNWIITNFEFMRLPDRLAQLLGFADKHTLLVIDESSAIKSHRSKQTKATLALRRRCGRVTELNGTPISHSPLDLFSQSAVLAPMTGRGVSSAMVDCSTFMHFRSRYAIMGGFLGKQVISWQNLEDLTNRMKPYVLRRLKKDCLDLPPVMPPVTMTATLTPETWKVYKEMREQLVAQLKDGSVATAAHAAVRALRLAQITSGFVGGIEEGDQQELDLGPEVTVDADRPTWLGGPGGAPRRVDPMIQRDTFTQTTTRRIGGDEKLKIVLDWYQERASEEKNFKLLLWCRFRPELFAYVEAFERIGVPVYKFHGGQKPDERSATLRALDPRTTPNKKFVAVGTTATGKRAFNFTAAHHMIYSSNDYSLDVRIQSMARVDRPGQLHSVWHGDVTAVGPSGQQTIDHVIIKALRNREDVATWTTSRWITVLTQEL